MDPRPVLHPVGPLPPRVYWTRRLVLLAAVLLLVVVVAVSCSGSGSGSPAAHPSPSPSPSPVSTATPGPCPRTQLAVTASTDADRYPPGSLPRLRVAIRNSGATSCVLTESPSTRTWTIVSGADQVWTTSGCAAPHTATDTTLKPGASVHHTVPWNRHRSDKKCAVTTAAAPGTYQLTVTVDGVTSGPAVFHLTG